MARGNKRCRKICGRIQFVSEDKEQDRRSSRKVEAERGTRETVDISNSRLHHKVTGGSWERCNLSGLR